MRPSNKLNFAKLEFFEIFKILGLVIYKLDLPESIKITRIHHVSVLKLIDPEASLMENIPDINPKSQEKVWKIKKILNINLINNS